MTEEQKEAIKKIVKQYGIVNASLTANKLGIQYETARSLLQQMTDEGILDRNPYKVNKRWKVNYRLKE
jgi:ribosomal protein S25